jgi:hypothetical protein
MAGALFAQYQDKPLREAIKFNTLVSSSFDKTVRTE